jgi:hypothetical protein
MYMEADLLDDVDDVIMGERLVLEGLNEAPELTHISNGRSKSETLSYVSTGVETGLQSTMPVHSRTSRAN